MWLFGEAVLLIVRGVRDVVVKAYPVR